MPDKKFLQWVHNRLHEVHNEPLNADYMHKLRAIIADTNSCKDTPNVVSFKLEDENE